MTWRELKNFINKRARDNKGFLDADVNLYDFETELEHEVNLTELSCSNDEAEENSDTNWVAYLSINDEETDNETEAEETSIT